MECIRQINETTQLVLLNGVVRVVKRIGAEELELYRRLLTIRHPHLVRFTEILTQEDGFYAVEEYLSGETLQQRVERQGVLSDGEAARIALEICSGLQAVHARGIIHRDVTASNVMITEDGVTKIIDFGISRLQKADQRTDTQILGTHGYAAPEQYGFRQTDHRADIYALGVLINYMKTGCMPNEKTAEGKLQGVIQKCIRIDEEKRYKDTEALMQAIRRLRLTPHAGADRFGWLPGFRKGVWWHSLIASLYYFFAAFFTIVLVAGSKSLRTACLQFLICFFALVLPVPILFDTGGWTRRLPGGRQNRPHGGLAFRLPAALLSILAALIFIIIDQGG